MTAVTSAGGLGPVGMSCHGWKLRCWTLGTADSGSGRGRRRWLGATRRIGQYRDLSASLRSRSEGAKIPQARVAEWQTQWTQNPPGATPCEFDSRLGHFHLPTYASTTFSTA